MRTTLHTCVERPAYWPGVLAFTLFAFTAFSGLERIHAQSDEEIVESQGGKVIDATKIAQEKLNFGQTITNTKVETSIALNSQQRLLQKVEQSEAKGGPNATTNQARQVLGSTSQNLAQDGAATSLSSSDYASMANTSVPDSASDTGGPTSTQTGQWQTESDETTALSNEDALEGPLPQDGGGNSNDVAYMDEDGNEYDSNGDPIDQSTADQTAAGTASNATGANGGTTDGTGSTAGGTQVYPTAYAQNEGSGAGTTSDTDTDNLRSASGVPLSPGAIAVNPQQFPYGTQYTIPDNPQLNSTLIAAGAPTTPDGQYAILTSTDTGSAVVAGTAANANGYSGTPVVDIYAGSTPTQYKAVEVAENDKPVTLVPYHG